MCDTKPFIVSDSNPLIKCKASGNMTCSRVPLVEVVDVVVAELGDKSQRSS